MRKKKANPQHPKESTTILTAKELSQNNDFDEELTQTQTHGCLYIKVTIDNIEHEMLVDSGADISVISSELEKK